jgi:DNA-binding beta-propeller fold protein YncE
MPFSRITRTMATSALAAAVLGSGAVAATSARAATGPVSDAHIQVHFDLKAGQMPENIVLDRNGTLDVSLAGSRQVARISRAGRISVLATLPAPADAKAKTPLLGFPLTTGLVREGKTFYVAYATGSTETGIWKFTEGHPAHKIADLPDDGLPNGLAMNRKTGVLYVTDSADGTVHSITTRGKKTGRVRLFSDSPALAATGFFGVNGAKVHGQKLYVSNLDRGTVLSAPLTGSHRAAFQPVAENLVGVDDFEFTGKGDQFLASLITKNKVVLVNGAGKHRTVLTEKDGLSNPSSVAVRGTTVYIPSAAYTTQKDPNLLVARLNQH